MSHREHSEHRPPLRMPFWLGFCLFAAIAAFFLWEEHRAHILGALPWLIVLACPLIHIFMHRKHRAGGGPAPGQHGPSNEGAP